MPSFTNEGAVHLDTPSEEQERAERMEGQVFSEANKPKLARDFSWGSQGSLDSAKRWSQGNCKNIAIFILAILVVILTGLTLHQELTNGLGLSFLTNESKLAKEKEVLENLRNETRVVAEEIQDMKNILKDLNDSTIINEVKETRTSIDVKTSKIAEKVQELEDEVKDGHKDLKKAMKKVENSLLNPHKAIACLAKMKTVGHIRSYMSVQAFRSKLYLFVSPTSSYRMKNHEEAKQSCKDKEMELVSIQSHDENSFLMSQADDANWYWTSGWRNSSSSSKWMWGKDGDQWAVEGKPCQTTSNNNATCVFPFTYKGVEYNGCTSSVSSPSTSSYGYTSKEWCATDNTHYRYPYSWGRYHDREFTSYGECGKCEGTYRNWNENEPNNHQGTEECLTMDGKTGKWNDHSCDKKGWYICEIAC